MKALLQQALDALEDLVPDPEIDFGPAYEYAKKQQKLAIKALRAELTKPKPVPVAWLDPWTGKNATTDYDAYGRHGIPLFTKEQL